MHYWNQDNFEGLRQVSEILGADSDLALLARYCHLREQGLRHQAFSVLEQFLRATRAFDSDTARSSVVKILTLNAQMKNIYHFISQPLSMRFLFPTLQSWVKQEPNSPEATRWLAILAHDHNVLAHALSLCPQQLLRHALSICPEDNRVRELLIKYALSDIDNATEHLLPHNFFYGNIDQTIVILNHARELIINAATSDAYPDLLSEIEYYDALIADWKIYSQNPTNSFADWCVQQERKY